MTGDHWPETRAAVERLKKSWRDLQEARAESRKLDREIKARRLLLRALRLDPDVLDAHAERVVSVTFDRLLERGLLNLPPQEQSR